LFSTIVASFLIETYKTLTPVSGSPATPSAIRVNIILFLSLFFSVTSALASTLIRQWAREYLQYSQPSAAPNKRGRVRAYLFDGLSRFQMKRLIYGVPVLLHLAVFLFFYALSEWLYAINVHVGATARYSFAALLTVYIALSVLPVIVRNSPYQTALTTPLQACISLISYIVHLLVGRFSRAYEVQKRFGLFKNVHVDRARALMNEVKKRKRASELDRSAIHWLLQELDEDDMDTFLSGLPGYIHSPSIDRKVVVEGLMEDGVPGRIREHITTCLRSVELSQEESMSRASACTNSLRLIVETAVNTGVRRSDSVSGDIRAIMEHLEPLRYETSTALRALCVRSLVIREFLTHLGDWDAKDLQTKKFPTYLMPLSRAIRVWKTREIARWSYLTGILTSTRYPLPTDQGMWEDVIYDGPLINLAVLAYAVLSLANEGDINLDMAWKTFEVLLKSIGLAQLQASAQARARFDEVLLKAGAGISGYERGRAQIAPLLKSLDIVTSGLRLAEVFVHNPKPMLPPRQIEAIFGPEQLRNSELLEAFAAHLPELINASTPGDSKSFMKRLILEDRLWEQLHFSLLRCLDPQVPFPDKLRIIMAFFDIFDVAFDALKESSIMDWRPPDLNLLFGHLWEFEMKVAPGMLTRRAVNIRSMIFHRQFCHVLLAQFSRQRSRGEPLMMQFFNSLTRLVWLLGVKTQEDDAYSYLTPGKPSNAGAGPDMMIKADAILSVTLRDGPLSNFCMLARLTFDVVASEVSDLTSEDTKKLWKVLERMLDTPHLPLDNASGDTWVRFDHLRALVDPVLYEGDDPIMKKLLDMIEKVERMRPSKRPSADRLAEGNADNNDGSTDRNVLQPGPPIPAHLGDPRHSPPVLGTVPAAGPDQFTPHGWTSTASARQSDLEPVVVDASRTSSIPLATTGTQLSSGAEIPVPSVDPPHLSQVHPQSFASPPVPGTSVDPKVDPTNLQAQAHTQPELTDIPVEGMLSDPYPSPSPSSGPLGVLQSIDAEQHGPVGGD
jgi:Family of unknown function (DUF6535)